MENRKKLQTARMHKYFIDATVKIIESEGIEHVTVRKVGQLAGFTGSTLYNYFDDLSHLVFFASMRFLDDYNQEVLEYIEKASTPLDKYLTTWECFCKHTFNKPEIFNAIFLSDLGGEPNALLERYYNVYSSDFSKFPEELKLIVLEHDLKKRNRPMLLQAVDQGYFVKNDIDMLLALTILAWKGMLTDTLNNRLNCSPEESTKMTMEYIRELTRCYISKEVASK
ncbi:TetR/AcrR family transcriptional regulator [Sporosarcina jiandibaonis]|uniref:TetR/AcrR family transcriptional regulator n=1 Tax=Sporosarcina jiandibaonis TaxID=2715535 RepID=UPI001556EB6F|nr:TetR/AcrR family transcriptional regulator [Sporosarcina jiandibaonis]